MPDITAPVNLNGFEKTIADNPHEEGSNWSLPCYNALKTHVREHYSIIQGDICCYCKINIRHGGYGEPIEHLVPKSDRPQWMFEPKNLALSCYPCNTKKNADNTLSAKGKVSTDYPDNTEDFLIYHPHFDIWSEHFSIFFDFFLIPNSPKGHETFDVCELYRLTLPLDKAKQKNWEEEPFRVRIIERVLMDPTATQKVKDQCTEISKEIIRRAKKKREILGN